MNNLEPSGPLATLDAALDGLASVALSCWSPTELVSHLVGLQTTRAKLDAVLCAATAEADRAAAQTTTGHRSIATSISAQAKCDSMPVARDRTLGRWVDGYADFAAAFTQGRLTRRHVEAIRGIDNPRSRAALHESQAALITAAETCTWKEFTELLRYWLLAADPDGLEPAAQQQQRKLSIRTRDDGMLEGRFLLDPIEGSGARTALEFEAQRLFRHDAEQQAAGDDNHRTATQRRADALTNLLAAGHRHNDGPSARPLINIVISEDVAADAMTRLTDPEGVRQGDYPNIDPFSLPLRHDDITARCELIDGTPIHPRQALPLLASAELRRLVMSASGEVLDMGRKVRNFPKHLKQALLMKARGRCEFDGCDAPFAWLQADHVIPWSNAGPTSIQNGQILCDPHNKAKSDSLPNQPPPDAEAA